MAKWYWDNVKSVRGWTQFDDYFDVVVELNDGHTHTLKVKNGDLPQTLDVQHLIDGEELPDD